ncbi:uncharacterized protein ACOB8E_020606 isoform 4-T4 [Sarcophilus harrisii]
MEPEGSRELIFPPLTEPVDAPVPNLTPRHQELIPTPCGPIKPWSELSCPVKVYFCITLVSLLSIIGLTIKTLVQKSDENFTVSLIQLIGVVFCIYYVTRGILQENRQELIVFILSILLVMFRSLVNFLVLTAEERPAREDPVILILRELKVLVWIFLVQNVPEVAYLFYLLYTQSLGPGQLVHWRSGGHCGLVHLCGHQVCLALGPGPRVSKLRPGPERENVFFLWKDRVLSSPQTPQGPRAGQTPPPASAARSQQPSSEEPHRCLPCMWQ